MGACLKKKREDSSAALIFAKRIQVVNEVSPQKKDNSRGLNLVLPYFDFFSQSNQIFDAQTAELVLRKKTANDFELIANCFRNSSIFTSLSDLQIEKVTESMSLYKLKASETIVEQGKPGHMFFIISQGSVVVVKDEKRLAILKEGNCFGELALIHNTFRSSTITALTDVEIWGITREVFKRLIEEINTQQYLENKEFLKKIPIFQSLRDSQLDSLIRSLVGQKFPANSKILAVNEQSDSIFILKEGVVNCVVQGREVSKMNSGEYFGEISILAKTTRNATIIAHTDVVCLIASKENLMLALGDNLSQVLYHNLIKRSIKSHKFLGKLISEQIELLIKLLKLQNISNDLIVSEENSQIFMVLRGDFTLENQKVEEFTFIGLDEVLFDQKRTRCEVKCNGEGEFASVSVEELKSIMPGGYSMVEENSEIRKVLKKTKSFSHLTVEKIRELSECLEIRDYSIGDTLLTEGDIPEFIYIVRSGTFYNIDTQEEHGKLEVLGEKSVISELPNAFTVKCQVSGSCYLLSSLTISKFLDFSTISYLKSRFTSKDNLPQLDSIEILTSTLITPYGNTFIVSNIQTQVQYSLKTLSKYQLQGSLSKYFKQEINILKSLDHFALPEYFVTYKDHSRIYILMRYINAVPFESICRNFFSEFEEKLLFFTSCLVDILEHLDSKNVIHRGINFENLVVGHDGYLNLINFSLACICHGRTYTVLGSPYHMSPEMITNKGYNLSSDYWSLGVVMFEIISQEVPFGANEKDPYKIYELILEKRIIYTKCSQKVVAGKRVLEQLLCKNPEMRMPGGIKNFKLDKYFKDIDWDLLKIKKIQSPVIPSFPEVSFLKQPLSSLDPNESIKDFPINWDEGF